ncbi:MULTISPECIES: GntR family transcriptional regulator [unclassified Brevibacterium]|uniref:GntR family transcriptional regulator n=1 Tax=Brevibacterium sp. H-BE7 TaxID=1727208 RepID=UPI001E3E970A|nr:MULTISPECIES: GntR family transcriptional regulator [unclassified Brevibacterium]MCD1287371.1 GntR family transcriptional regulator [Brevibacterium sp. CCUG 69071]MDK8436835.1 GntR family transcriptional regulator [Brevibacterium sp. H-BE7]
MEGHSVKTADGETSEAELSAESGSLSKAETAYRWLRRRIADQTFDPGHKLVLAQIALELDTSVVPVREAIRRLEADGLVTFERNVGARVAMVDQSSYAQSMEAVAILEGAATAQALEFLTEDDLAEAEAINERMRALLDDFDATEFTRLNHEFHAALFRRCPNERLHSLVAVEWDRLAHLRNSTFSFVPERALGSVDEHARIVALIRARASADEIERVVRGHRSATLHSYQEAQAKTTEREEDKS